MSKKKQNNKATEKQVVTEVSTSEQQVGVSVTTSIGDIIVEPELKIGAKVLSDVSGKAFIYEGKTYHVNKDGIIHMCYE